MKKILSILFAAALLTGFTSCGMSEEERKADSMLNDTLNQENEDAVQRMIDSMERANAVMDSMANIAADSIKNADSIANLKK